jgi:hypothetical protein
MNQRAGLANVDHAIAEYMAGLLDETGAVAEQQLGPLTTEVGGVAVPLWAQRAFWVDQVHAGGLALALPQRLFRPLQGALKPARKSDPPFIAGVIEENGRRWCCIEPRLFLLGDKTAQAGEYGGFYAVEGSAYAIGVAQQSGEVEVVPEQVLWRGEAGRRPWLAGVRRDPQQAILDASGVIEAVEAILSER